MALRQDCDKFNIASLTPLVSFFNKLPRSFECCQLGFIRNLRQTGGIHETYSLPAQTSFITDLLINTHQHQDVVYMVD